MNKQDYTQVLQERIAYWQRKIDRIRRFQERTTSPHAKAAFEGQVTTAQRVIDAAQAELIELEEEL